MKILRGAAVAAAAMTVMLGAIGPAGAGDNPLVLAASPNPANVGQVVTVTPANEAAFCGFPVNYLITAPDESTTPGDVTPNEFGDFSFQFTPDQTGTYHVDAWCNDQDQGQEPSQYYPVEVRVLGGSTSTTTTTTAAPATTTTVAAAATTAAPRFTG